MKMINKRMVVKLITTKGIDRCPRCDGDHGTLAVNQFVRRAGHITHWATCPSTGEPILFEVGRNYYQPE